MFKPFKQPLLKRIVQSAPNDLTNVPESDSDEQPEIRPAKKRRLIHVVVDSPPPKQAAASSGVLAPRKPLLVVKNPIETKLPAGDSPASPEGYYMVLWYVNLSTFHDRLLTTL